MDKKPQHDKTSLEKNEANVCMALGAGVGILGVASATLTGAMCPLCIFVAPGLLGLGAYRRWRSTGKKETSSASLNPDGAAN